MRIEGYWYFPELEKELFGTLIKENNKIDLKIIGDFPFNQCSMLRFPLVSGKTCEGNFTLIDCIWDYRWRFNTESNTKTSYLSCYSVIRSHYFNTIEELKFNHYKFNFSGLKDWVCHEVDMTKRLQEVNEEYNKILFKVNDDLHGEILIQTDALPRQGVDVAYGITQETYIQVSS